MKGIEKIIIARALVPVHTHTHTSSLKNIINKIEIRNKGNIVLPCGFIDTG